MSKTNDNIQVQEFTKAIKLLGQDMDTSFSSLKGLINHKALPNGLLEKSSKSFFIKIESDFIILPATSSTLCFSSVEKLSPVLQNH